MLLVRREKSFPSGVGNLLPRANNRLCIRPSQIIRLFTKISKYYLRFIMSWLIRRKSGPTHTFHWLRTWNARVFLLSKRGSKIREHNILCSLRETMLYRRFCSNDCASNRLPSTNHLFCLAWTDTKVIFDGLRIRNKLNSTVSIWFVETYHKS